MRLPTGPLADLRIWVTRPAGQAAALADLLQQAGATPVVLPLLCIAPPADPEPLQMALARLDECDLAAFVSPSALDAVFDTLGRAWPQTLPAAVVGPGSTRRALALGIRDVIAPAERFDSEGLLAEPAMQAFAGKRIVLFRGENGRELLVDGLQKLAGSQGGSLTVVPAYRRLPPDLSDTQIAAALDAGCDGIIVSSSEAAQHLFAAVGATTRERLQSMHYFVPHPRIGTALEQQGVHAAHLTEAGDAGIVATLCRYFASQLP
ncbi:uroporphyrinogen-III synthase [Andreprevotia chitinilytica]|uniref:uroporphyrinogen-III synthase n=1 Tax=Andreprevotia chitinilytica TaxID=396808 RepID=UPI0005550835|nr:uroporphyrinogen-III synthase [Andreprevotia chitinilytica]